MPSGWQESRCRIRTKNVGSKHFDVPHRISYAGHRRFDAVRLTAGINSIIVQLSPDECRLAVGWNGVRCRRDNMFVVWGSRSRQEDGGVVADWCDACHAPHFHRLVHYYIDV